MKRNEEKRQRQGVTAQEDGVFSGKRVAAGPKVNYK